MGAACCSMRNRSLSAEASTEVLAKDHHIGYIRLEDFLQGELEVFFPSVTIYTRMSTWTYQVRVAGKASVSDMCVQKLVIATIRTENQLEVVAACLLVNEFPRGHNGGSVDIRWLDSTGYTDEPTQNIDSILLNSYLVYAKQLGYDKAFFCVSESSHHPDYIFGDSPHKHESCDSLSLRYEREVMQQKTYRWVHTTITPTSSNLPLLPNPLLMQALYGASVRYEGGYISPSSNKGDAAPPVLLILLARTAVGVMGVFRESDAAPDEPSDMSQIAQYPRGFGSWANVIDAAASTQKLLRRVKSS
eukprot:TRINITY_DN15138_c0_g1_i1.p1 TRINITY_DN15138_c0_g1~~TRINITY_DN15138_c0_g1_i1.p1  ORF type:complete len:303 (-),score=30.01 TRINITY_DN15138_c0_g1_i1:218-1126(-)